MVSTGEFKIDWDQDGILLSAEQKRFFEKNGYLLVRKCVPQYEIDRYLNRFKLICDSERSEFPAIMVMRDISLAKTERKKGVEGVSKIQNWQDDKVLFDFCKYPAIVDIVKDLIGSPSSCHEHNDHQQTARYRFSYISSSSPSRSPIFPLPSADFIVCAWTAMERINRANGCLVVVPGTHKGHLQPHVYHKWEGGVNKGYHGIEDYDPNMPRTYVEMEAGDTVFFHPLIIHGSGANKTNGFRRAISCHYANDDICRYHHEKSTEETDKEVTEMIRERLTS